jgi:hypothetical protein
MTPEEFLVTNWRSKYNPLLDKANREMPQYTFDDVTEMMEAYHRAEAEKLLNKLKHPTNTRLFNRRIDGILLELLTFK